MYSYRISYFFLESMYHKLCVPEQSCVLDNLEEIELEHENKMTKSSKNEENKHLTPDYKLIA